MDKIRALRLSKIGIIILLCFMISGCIGAAVTGAGLVYDHNNVSRKATDFYLDGIINNTIKNDSEFNNSRVAVTVFHRIVLLTGQVPTEKLRKKAVTLIQSIPNIRRIYNSITISKPISLAKQTDDVWLTTQIKGRLIASKEIDPNAIKVVTENSVVYLIGIVTHPQANIAIQIARSTRVVRKVVIIFFYFTVEGLSDQ